ncbi:hypothetical protein MHK_010218, partial [Candidatus Magnetomorum sp. HK-1]
HNIGFIKQATCCGQRYDISSIFPKNIIKIGSGVEYLHYSFVLFNYLEINERRKTYYSIKPKFAINDSNEICHFAVKNPEDSQTDSNFENYFTIKELLNVNKSQQDHKNLVLMLQDEIESKNLLILNLENSMSDQNYNINKNLEQIKSLENEKENTINELEDLKVEYKKLLKNIDINESTTKEMTIKNNKINDYNEDLVKKIELLNNQVKQQETKLKEKEVELEEKENVIVE